MTSDLDLAQELADSADRVSSRYFAAGPVPYQTKADGSPVTAADREVEETLLALVSQRRPEDAFLGEEVGAAGAGQRRWIVDGVDGTHAFVAGAPQWGTLVALEVAGALTVGVATSPGLGRRWWASQGGGAWTASLRDGRLWGQAKRLVVSDRPLPVARAAVLPGPEQVDGWRRSVAERIRARLDCPTLDGHGPQLVSAGAIEISVHLGGGPWDHAAFAVIVEEAGGCFRDLWGGRRLDTATALFASSTPIADAVLQLAAPLVSEATGSH